MALVAITRAQRDETYGPLTWYGLNRGVVAERLRSMPTPWGTKVTVHELVASHWAEAMEAAAAEVPEFRPRRTDSFVPRLIRASTAISMHAYGLAIDFFTTPYPTPPPGGVWTPLELRTPEAAAFRAVFARYGFRLGADFTRVDLPHIEWAAAPPTKRPPVVPPPPPPPPVIVPPVPQPDTEELDDMGATVAQFDTYTIHGPLAVVLEGDELKVIHGGQFIGADIAPSWRATDLLGQPTPDVLKLGGATGVPIVGKPTEVLRTGVNVVTLWTREANGTRHWYQFTVASAPIRSAAAAAVLSVAAITWRGTVEVAVGITAVIACLLAILALSPPIRYAWRKLVAEPYWAAHRRQTMELVEPVAQAVSELADETRKGRHRLHERLDEFGHELSGFRLELARHDARVRGASPADDPEDVDFEEIRGEIPPLSKG